MIVLASQETQSMSPKNPESSEIDFESPWDKAY